MNVLLAGCLLIITAALEALVWRNARARPRQSEEDGGTARLISAATALGVVGGLVLHTEAAPRWMAAGIVVWTAGVALRRWAVVTLGDAFTLSLRPISKLVRSGPYRLLRHPAYVGGQLALVGVGLALGNAGAALAMWAPTALAHALRIRLENRLLDAAHDEGQALGGASDRASPVRRSGLEGLTADRSGDRP